MKSNTKKIIILAGLLFLVVWIIPTHQAHAFIGTLIDIGTDLIVKVVQGIMYLLNYILATLFALASLKIMDKQTNPILETGWTIVRDVANLGFVLAIVIIAIATILRFEKYGMQKLLPKLVAAAILVNFSLTIAGVLIDFSNVITTFFLDKATGANISEFTTQVSNAFGPQRFLLPDQDPLPPNPRHFWQGRIN